MNGLQKLERLKNIKCLKNKQLKFNFKQSPPNPKNYKVTFTKLKEIPILNTVDNSKYCSPISDQGNSGACTAFASVSSMEFIMNKANNKYLKLSEKFTYYVSRVNIEKTTIPPPDDGAYLCDTLKGLVKYGSCLNTTCPFVNINSNPDKKAYTECTNYQVITYAQYDDATSTSIKNLPTTIKTIKASIAAGYPVIAGFTCYSNIYNTVKGVIPLPTEQDSVIGGHAILIVGYNDITKQFKFKNSWGASWGVNGFGFLPYQYYLSGDMVDIWSIFTGKINSDTCGIVITTPVILQNQMSDIFDQVMLNYSYLSSSTTLQLLFTNLLNKYKDTPKLITFIKSMQNNLTNFMK